MRRGIPGWDKEMTDPRIWTHETGTHLHLKSFLPAFYGIILKGELILSNNGPAVLVTRVRDHIELGRPHLELSLPVDDGGERSAHQEGTFGVALGGRGGIPSGLAQTLHASLPAPAFSPPPI